MLGCGLNSSTELSLDSALWSSSDRYVVVAVCAGDRVTRHSVCMLYLCLAEHKWDVLPPLGVVARTRQRTPTPKEITAATCQLQLPQKRAHVSRRPHNGCNRQQPALLCRVLCSLRQIHCAADVAMSVHGVGERSSICLGAGCQVHVCRCVSCL